MWRHLWSGCEENDLSGCGFHSLKCLVNVDLIIFMCGLLWSTLVHYRRDHTHVAGVTQESPLPGHLLGASGD